MLTYQATLTERQLKLLAEAVDAKLALMPEDDRVGSDFDELGVLLEWLDEPQTHLVRLDPE